MTLSLPFPPPPAPIIPTSLSYNWDWNSHLQGFPSAEIKWKLYSGSWGKGVSAEGLNLGSSGSVREGGSCASLKFQLLSASGLSAFVLPRALCS